MANLKDLHDGLVQILTKARKSKEPPEMTGVLGEKPRGGLLGKLRAKARSRSAQRLDENLALAGRAAEIQAEAQANPPGELDQWGRVRQQALEAEAARLRARAPSRPIGEEPGLASFEERRRVLTSAPQPGESQVIRDLRQDHTAAAQALRRRGVTPTFELADEERRRAADPVSSAARARLEAGRQEADRARQTGAAPSMMERSRARAALIARGEDQGPQGLNQRDIDDEVMEQRRRSDARQRVDDADWQGSRATREGRSGGGPDWASMGVTPNPTEEAILRRPENQAPARGGHFPVGARVRMNRTGHAQHGQVGRVVQSNPGYPTVRFGDTDVSMHHTNFNREPDDLQFEDPDDAWAMQQADRRIQNRWAAAGTVPGAPSTLPYRQAEEAEDRLRGAPAAPSPAVPAPVAPKPIDWRATRVARLDISDTPAYQPPAPRVQEAPATAAPAPAKKAPTSRTNALDIDKSLKGLHDGLVRLLAKRNLTPKETMSTTLKKDSPWAVDSSAPPPTPLHGAQKASPMWLGKYPMVSPDHQQELETEAAVNEFGRKLPRPQAEQEAHRAYTARQRTQAAYHHLASMKSANAGGDKESARKHSLMYQIHMRDLGMDPTKPPTTPLDVEPWKARFRHHPADMYAADPQAPAGAVISSAQAPAPLSRHEALGRLLEGCEALLKDETRPLGDGAPAPEPKTASGASTKTPEEHQQAMQRFLQVHEGRGPLPFFGFNGGHFKLGPNVWNYSDGIHQVAQPAHVTFAKTPIARVRVQRDQEGNHGLVDEGGLTWKRFDASGMQKAEKAGDKQYCTACKDPLDKAGHCTVKAHWPLLDAKKAERDPGKKNVLSSNSYAPASDPSPPRNRAQAKRLADTPANRAREISLYNHLGRQTDKAELVTGAKKSPCRCESYSWPHRHGGGKCRSGK